MDDVQHAATPCYSARPAGTRNLFRHSTLAEKVTASFYVDPSSVYSLMRCTNVLPIMDELPDDDERERCSGRRDFLKTLSRGVGATVLASSTGPLVSRAASPRDEKLGVALVGLGNYATGQLAPALQETTKCALTGIVTGTPSKARTWQKKYDIPDENVYNYETYDDIAANDDIDIVYVVLPNGMHAEYTIRAAEAGKHVICEKPMATSVEECKNMIAACNKAGTKLSIGYRLHFEPHHQRVMELGQEEVFGSVNVMQAGFGFRISDGATDEPHIEWRLDKEMAGGGALMDVGIYVIQAGRYVTGEEPVAVSAQEYTTRPEVFDEVDETIFFQLEFPGGTRLSGSTSYNASFNRLYAAAVEGTFEIEPAYGYGGIQGRTHEGPMGISNVNQQARQMDAFAECIRQGRTSTVSGEEGLRDLEVIEAIYQSIAAGGTRVQLEHS